MSPFYFYEYSDGKYFSGSGSERIEWGGYIKKVHAMRMNKQLRNNGHSVGVVFWRN